MYSAIEGYNCPRCGKQTVAHSAPSFLTFPDHLLVVMRRFLFDAWVPSKLDVSVPLTPLLDLEDLRGKGLQAGEEELPTTSSSASTSALTADPGIVSQLEGMGFTSNAASRAALAVSNSDGEAAMNWLLAHMDDADLNDPLPAAAPASSSSTSSSSGAAPPAELIEQLTSMGFDHARCVYALQQTSNSVDRAVEWLFSHSDDPLPSTSTAASAPSPAPATPFTSSQYRLYAAITHLGKVSLPPSTHSHLALTLYWH